MLYIFIYNITPKSKYGRIYIPRVKNKTVICHLSLLSHHLLTFASIPLIGQKMAFVGYFFI